MFTFYRFPPVNEMMVFLFALLRYRFHIVVLMTYLLLFFWVSSTLLVSLCRV